MNFASRSTIACALGPGSAVTRRGVFVSVVMIIAVSLSSHAVKTAAFRVLVDPGSSRCVGMHECVRAPGVSGLRLVRFGKGLNLRRRGSDAVRKEKLVEPAGAIVCVSFAFPADASVLTIFQNYTMFREFFADFVAFCKVPPLPCRLPFRNQGLDFRVQYPSICSVPQFLQFLLIGIGDHREYFVKR